MEKFVEGKFGAEALNKLENMHRGGKNNEKGNRLEDRFAVFKIASLANMAATAEPELQLLKQEKGFVDDVVITYPNSKKKENFQAKDVQTITWSAFTENFEMQYAIDIEHHGYDSSWTNALLSNKKQYEKLSGKVPESIKTHTKCEYFPNDESLPSLLISYPPLKESLEKLSKKKGDLSYCETIFAQIMGQWSISDTGKVIEILDNAKKNARPNLFTSDKCLDFDQDALKILEEIAGLTYSLDHEELNISCNGCTLLMASKEKNNINRCENLLKEQQPKTLIELINVWQSLSKACR
ncbi:hypothetical protein DUG83_24405 [Vibrio parahaemolyticus]|uniref:hypothetical protein n=1 Tax=Vibrio harveyi group TaxID=717610 RepID=UPI00100F0BFD|nr:hypothetical protein [Vibrio parahaemolyticus]EGQ9819102.1 hypothetical protein [Vibrio parahaemolyticus]EGR2303443.1 hypothetical protein [Vibrio parahaemolyticus]EGR2724552.1 hypothetical protein [Vibrio parahaemolyticus]EGS6764465.1 hypothetical protein [Vibrio parahaemolyticus]EGY8744495.1 hypothetical protein [Vibrio parahaemolyticus]